MNYENIYNRDFKSWYKEEFCEIAEYIEGADKLYPKLDIKFSDEDITQLDNYFKNGKLNSAYMTTAIEKLLYVYLWKQRGLDKPYHIYSGLLSNNIEDLNKGSLVLSQFGRFLSTDSEPMVDQHTLRAYSMMQKIKPELNKNGQIKATYAAKDQVSEYIVWLKAMTTDAEKMFVVDRIMFAIGKHIKSKNGKS